jgi:hypothetical protein
LEDKAKQEKDQLRQERQQLFNERRKKKEHLRRLGDQMELVQIVSCLDNISYPAMPSSIRMKSGRNRQELS